MIRGLEFTGFVCLAVAIHAAVLTRVDVGALPAAGGTAMGGASVGSATGDLVSLIESWTEEPEVAVIDEPVSELGEEGPLEASRPSDVAALAEVPPNLVAAAKPEPLPILKPMPAELEGSQVIPRAPEQLSEPAFAVPSTTAPSALPLTEVARLKGSLQLGSAPSATVTDLPRRPETEPARDANFAPVVAVAPIARPERANRRPRAPQTAKPVKAQTVQTAQPTTAVPQPSTGNTGQKLAINNSDGQSEAGGLSAQKGQGGVAPAASSSPGAVSSAQAAYVAAVQKAVRHHWRYPKRAMRRQITGTVNVLLTLNATGELLDANVVRSSGAEVLDAAALKAVRSVGRYPSIPAEMNKARASVTFPIRYEP